MEIDVETSLLSTMKFSKITKALNKNLWELHFVNHSMVKILNGFKLPIMELFEVDTQAVAFTTQQLMSS